MAAVYNDTVVFSEHFEYEPDGHYLDHDTNAQLYSAASNFEIEVLNGGSILKPGDSTSRTIYWNLQHLPEKPANDIEAFMTIWSKMELTQKLAF